MLLDDWQFRDDFVFESPRPCSRLTGRFPGGLCHRARAVLGADPSVLCVRSVRTDVTLKRTRPPTDFEEIDRWEGGVGWIAHPDEAMLRASHALAADRGSDGGEERDGDGGGSDGEGGDGEGDGGEGDDEGSAVWVVDPVDAPDIDDLFAEFGDVAGVVVLINRHYRDADEIARRHDVPIYVPAWFDDVPDDVSTEIRRFERQLPGTDYRLLKVVNRFGWEEGALYDEGGGTLVVAESVGNAPFFTTDDEELGVHPVRRLVPPSVLRGLRPDRVLVGHGPGILDDASRALSDALDGARRRTPKLFAQNLRRFLPE